MKRFILMTIVLLIILVPNFGATVNAEIIESEKILFTRWEDGIEQIYMMDDNGENIIRLTDSGGSHPVISYDGRYMIYRLGDYISHKNIFVDFQDGNIKEMLNYNLYIHSISGDNKKILYTRYEDKENYFLEELYIADIDGSNEKKIVSGSDVWEAVFSPTENIIAYVKRGMIFVMDLDTGKEIQLTRDMPCDGISWSDDGERIFYCGPEYEIMSISIKSKDKEILFKDDNIWSIKPNLSSKGEILFQGEGGGRIYRLKDSEEMIRLTDNHVDDCPMWIKTRSDRVYKVRDDI